MTQTPDPVRLDSTYEPIRVLIVDDHAIVRRGIRALLATEPDIEMVGEAEDGRTAVAAVGSAQPDVVLMDLVMPEMDGIEATRRITACHPEARILVLTSFASDDLVFPAIKAGALGYLLKDSSPEELVGAIHQVHGGQPSLHPQIAQKVLEELSRPQEQEPAPERLTKREIEILQSVARGQTNLEIADRLQVSEVAVRTYISGVLCKLHLASKTLAVLYALREGLASLDDLAPNYVTRLLAMLGKTTTSAPPLVEAGHPGMAQPAGHPSGDAELEALRLIAADHEKVGQELALAGEIQASFLPEVVPDVPGWQLTATLEPVRETAGDFYDFIPLPDDRLGILVADVTDKGMGAALYMALSRTLIRTFATEHCTRPDLVFSAVNGRILMDARASLFVTVFYGVLDPASGMLTYCNAGHDPPYLLSADDRDSVQELGRTGIPLGVFEDQTWQQRSVRIARRGMLVLYSDGLTDAQNRQGRFFGKERLLQAVRANAGRSARDLQEALIAQVHEFVGEEPKFDDITLMVVARSP